MPQIKGTFIKIEHFKIESCPSLKKSNLVKGQQVKPSQRSTSQLKFIQLSQLRESKITNTNEKDEGLVNFLSKHA